MVDEEENPHDDGQHLPPAGLCEQLGIDPSRSENVFFFSPQNLRVNIQNRNVANVISIYIYIYVYTYIIYIYVYIYISRGYNDFTWDHLGMY